eukprot:768813-Hanusia_phi.AAC.10
MITERYYDCRTPGCSSSTEFKFCQLSSRLGAARSVSVHTVCDISCATPTFTLSSPTTHTFTDTFRYPPVVLASYPSSNRLHPHPPQLSVSRDRLYRCAHVLQPLEHDRLPHHVHQPAHVPPYDLTIFSTALVDPLSPAHLIFRSSSGLPAASPHEM